MKYCLLNNRTNPEALRGTTFTIQTIPFRTTTNQKLPFWLAPLGFDEFPTYAGQRIHVVAANLDYAELSICSPALDRRVTARGQRKPSEDPSVRRIVRQNNVNGSGKG